MSAETFSRVYALLADRTSTPSGEEWEHGPLQRLVSDLLAVTCAADRKAAPEEETA